MRLSQLFTKTKREMTADDISVNARLLVRGGFIDKLSSGLYSFLPLGWRVFQKIENIIRAEMDAIGGQEILMPALHPKKNWEITGRWNTMDDLYKIKDKGGKEFALGPTHEEIIVPLAKQYINSYKDLPCYVYQIQDKFRMELRAKSGLLRGREFIMKDLYSFHADEADFSKYYEKVKKAYLKLFKIMGLNPIYTYASGGTFSKYSHEFQVPTGAGEDEIYVCGKCGIAVNKEIILEQKNRCPECGSKKLEIKKAIEVGNIFPLKTKFSEPFNLKYKDKKGEDKLVVMGCYGIGLSRTMGAIAEVHSDDKGIIWPDSVAPYGVELLGLSAKNARVSNATDKIYLSLQKAGLEVLYDDRDISAGEKFSDADLIGSPIRLVVSEKTLSKNSVGLKKRRSQSEKLIKISDLIKVLQNK